MKRNTLNFWIDLISFFTFLALVVTGLVIYYVLPPCGNCTGGGCAEGEAATLWSFGRHDFGAIHFYLALATVVLVVIHVCLHWTWVCHTACRLAGLNVTSPQRCRLWGTLLLVLLIALTIAALYLAKTQVR
ncbi:MAG: DUF4405 domain-containing protein [Sedimentisphaerales bacterium]|nr:DUF4405 domain-containing protein [Sedimentisphaerales bacterium]